MYVLYKQGILLYKNLEVGTAPITILKDQHLKLSEGLNDIQDDKLTVGLTRVQQSTDASTAEQHSTKFVHRFNNDEASHQQPQASQTTNTVATATKEETDG